MSNTNTENLMNALSGQNDSAGASEDWKSKYEALERKLQSERVEEGRLRKANEELEAARKRIAELENSDRTQKILADMPSDFGGEDIPDDFKNASAAIAARVVDKSMGGIEERMAKIERQTQEDAQSAFLNRINAKYPGFLDGIGVGGDKQAAWNKYLRHNKASVESAIKAGDYDTLVYHINNFYTGELGIPVPSGDYGDPASADPSASVGGPKVVEMSPGKIYTQAEILALYDQIEAARDRGDYAEKVRIENEVEKAQREGRVK